VSEPKYKRVADDVERLYWDHTSGEVQEMLNIGGSTYTAARKHAGLPKKTEKNRIEHTHGVDIERILYHLHHDALLSVNKMSDMLGVARKTLDRWFADEGVYKRGSSEAEQVKIDKMTDEELRQRTKAARVAQQEKYGDGQRIGEWVKNNPEEHAEVAREAAGKGAAAREENGMKGRTGQDHPKWRGGKHLIDALRKQLRPSWWTVCDKERADECYKCGASECKLDVHHIVPLSAGGTNDSWNLMTLCESCHRTAETYVRQFKAFDPVLTE